MQSRKRLLVELKVAYDGREVVYRSMADLVAARNLIKADLQKSGAIPKAHSLLLYL